MFGLIKDLVKVVVAPVEITTSIVRVVTKPLGDVAEAAAKQVKELIDND